MPINKRWVCHCDFVNAYNIEYAALITTRNNDQDFYEQYRDADKYCNELRGEQWDFARHRDLKNRLLILGCSFVGKFYFCEPHTTFMNLLKENNVFDKFLTPEPAKKRTRNKK